MVEKTRPSMLFLHPLSARAFKRSQQALFSFGSCKEAWYYRSFGLDP
ncbi:hypothetical protein RGQ29_011421 [Quercus rubra]|uniref:Uncharacterized protein n=1 Tax=Quercus rubra TaxID=3512 RepID=A0AAN7J8R5_QUERU|nr:hypothetical protein RGQ29_011421 [Quercus rubra]